MLEAVAGVEPGVRPPVGSLSRIQGTRPHTGLCPGSTGTLRVPCPPPPPGPVAAHPAGHAAWWGITPCPGGARGASLPLPVVVFRPPPGLGRAAGTAGGAAPPFFRGTPGSRGGVARLHRGARGGRKEKGGAGDRGIPRGSGGGGGRPAAPGAAVGPGASRPGRHVPPQRAPSPRRRWRAH